MVSQPPAAPPPHPIPTHPFTPSPCHPVTLSPGHLVTPSSPSIPDSLPTPLPPLTPHESELLSSFLILRYDLVALAETNKLNPLELLAFARSPAVQSHLAELKKFADQAFALRSLESRTNAINLLEEVAKTSDNPIEKRRAASAILRGLNPVGGVARASKPSNTVRLHPPHRQAPVSDATDHDNPLNRHQRPHFDSPLHPSTHSPLHPPLPSSLPSPNFSHIEAAELIGAALKSPSPESLATLHAFTATNATLGESNAPADLPTFIEVARAIVPKQRQHAVVIHTRKADDSSADILCTLTDAPCNATKLQYDFTLTRNPDRLWLLSSFKRRPESRGVG